MSAANTLHDELVTFQMPDGRRALALLPVIPEDAAYAIREGIARRRITALTGSCPCGAQIDYDAAHVKGLGVTEAYHDRRCPADTAKLVKAIRRWSR